MKGFACKVLVMLFVTLGLCSDLYAGIRYKQFDATVFCLVGVKDYCDTFEV